MMHSPRHFFRFLILMLTIPLLGVQCVPRNETILKDPAPVVIARLENDHLIFACLDRDKCIPDVKVSSYADPGFSIHLVNMHYFSSSSILVTFPEYGRKILHIDLETGQPDPITLPDNIKVDSSRGETLQEIAAHGKMIFVDQFANIAIIHEDLSIQTLRLAVERSPFADIGNLVEAADPNILIQDGAVNQSGETFARVFIISTDTGGISEKMLRIPELKVASGPDEVPQAGDKYAAAWEAFRGDMQRFFAFFLQVESLEKTSLYLGEFDTQTGEQIAFTDQYNCSLAVMIGFKQYQNIIYIDGIQDDLSGKREAALLGPGLKPIADLTPILQNELTGRLTIVPFGDYFLLGTDSRVLLMSLDGKIVKEYPLPQEWINRNYMILEYRE
jgi:hypothetical protein